VRITFDPDKRQRTLKERGLDFADAAIVFEGTTIEVDDTRRATVSVGSSASGFWPGAWWWSATPRAAQSATSSA
jgi:uncharacterized DUF497 family protein